MMDTTVRIEAAGRDEAAVKAAVDNALSSFQAVADETDRYKNASARGLFQLNAHAGQGPFVAGPHLFSLAQMAHEQSFTEFDATLVPLIDLWRQHGAAKTVPSKEEIAARLLLTGKDKLSIDQHRQTITLSAGAGLDLGAAAKGYAVDLAADVLAKDKNIASALINAGGNIKTVGTKTDGKPWRIALQHPRRPGNYLGIIQLNAQEAIATSGDYQRYYEIDGIRYHHILDPHTGKPAYNAISVTIVTPSALLADYYSTLLFVLPHEKALEVLATHPETAAIIVKPNQEIYISPSLQSRFEATSAGGK